MNQSDMMATWMTRIGRIYADLASPAAKLIGHEDTNPLAVKEFFVAFCLRSYFHSSRRRRDKIRVDPLNPRHRVAIVSLW
jgi:hypothetical protein